jgi:hypothetical protein
MRITMIDRRVVAKLECERYRKTGKKEKGRILDEFVKTAKCSRYHARWLLRNHGRRVEVKPLVFVEGDARQRVRQRRKKEYGPELLPPLKQLWEMLDFICGKRLVAALREVLPRLVACGEVRLRKSLQKKLFEMSASTIDRLLKTEREKYQLKKRRGGTKPGTLLKHQVPVRTYDDWNEAQPGFLEMDLVAHDGGTASGDYCHTLDMTDVATGWTEQRAVLNKAEKWVFEAIEDLRRELPFPVRGLDSDNGTEFINHHLVRYCEREKITFTRARPYRKNDTCYVEQKNWSLVRRFAGYARYEGQNVCDILNELYRILHDYNNFFLPSMKLREKTRNGARVLKRYHPPETPYQRVIESPHIDKNTKNRLRRYYLRLNPAHLYRQIQRLQQRLRRRSPNSQRTHGRAA